jgi:hypothetical protein
MERKKGVLHNLKVGVKGRGKIILSLIRDMLLVLNAVVCFRGSVRIFKKIE